MGSKKNFGRTIIDGLKLAYTLEPSIRYSWAKEKQVIYLGNLVFTRIESRTNFPHYFIVNYNREKIAYLYFHDDDACVFRKYVHVRMSNFVLYDSALLGQVLCALEEVGLVFDHFTGIDLARDFSYNVVQQLNRLMRSSCLATIINGKWIKDRNEKLSHFKEIRSRSLNRSYDPELVIKQDSMNQLKAYNKLHEIMDMRKDYNDDFYKDYIIDYYGHASSIHRLEVTIDSRKLRRLLISQSCNMLFSQDFLDELYVRCVTSILSFSLLPVKNTSHMRPRQQVHLDIIFGTGRDITKLCHQAKKYQPKELKYTRLKPVDLADMEQSEILPSINECNSTLDDFANNKEEWLVAEFDM